MSIDLDESKNNTPFTANSQPPPSDFRLDLFGRHIPKILSKQLMGKLFNQFTNQTGDNDYDQIGAFSCIPSITRFDAALLFVDISGFTVLSQKLPVDELRVSINSYFKIIIDTVMRYNGDVIKFAGDALFIVFPADSNEKTSENNEKTTMRKAITTAIQCGVEINQLCTNYRIDFKQKEKIQLNDSLTSLFLSHDAPPSLLDPMSPYSNQSSEMDHTFLNVHSGCAAGTFGGIDVGAMDRWEYLIIGQPLQDISEAESVAEKGELVLTEYAHDIYCLGALNLDKTYNIATEDGPPVERVTAEPAEDVIMPCGCRRTYNNCYRLKENQIRSQTEAPQVEEELEEEDYELQYYRDVVNSANVAFENGKHIVMRKFYEYLSQEVVDSVDVSNKIKTEVESNTINTTSKKSSDVLTSASLPVLPSATTVATTTTSTPTGINSLNQISTKTNSMQISDVNFVHDFYLKWIINCLTADFARHVHEADRGHYEVAKINRINCIEQCAKAYQDALTSGLNLNSTNTYVDHERDSSESFVRRIRNIVNNAHKSPYHHYQHPPLTRRPSLNNDNTNNHHHTRQNGHTNYLREQNQKKHEKLLKNDHELTGELRNVIMMFISIRSLSASTPRPSILKKTLYFRPNDDYDEVDGCPLDAFHFKRRSKVEKDSDRKLRNHYQTCMSLIVSALKEQGGQLRQFIVDDKGTVAIGSFGLRGSATYDNAASAVEAALSIIGHLQNVGLNASIGITSGKAYCGAVGSLRRHEYAVMGPSVNLSARLMGKGKPGEIICDASTRSVDRVHSYRPIGEIKAKGYENLVAIFKPVFMRGSANNISNIPRLLSTDYGFGVNEAGVAITPGQSTNREKITSREGGRTKRIQSKRLIGRDQEELQALEAILQDVLQLDEQHDHHRALHQICKDIQANLLETPYGLSVDTSLNTLCHSRIVVVNGTSGMGKSALITSVCDKLTEYSKISTWNLEILHGKSSNLTTSDPFKPWRTIIRAILGQFARYENIVKERREAEIDVPDTSLLAKKWKKGLDYVSSYLSEEEKALLPLLTAAHILPGLPETEVTKKLSGQEKLEYVIKVLQAILKYYPQLTNNVLLIVLDDSHSMDAHSWKLVHEVLLKNSGIIFLAGYYDEEDEVQSASTLGSSSLSSSSSRNQRHSRDHHGHILRHSSCRQIRLGGLDTTSIKLMMNNILEGYVDLSFMDPAVADALQEMSGGNPLYIYEICLASLEKIRAKAGPLDLSSVSSIDSITMERYILDFRTNRIDEVIYYRFDRLDAQSQLILKMGAIITASNSHRGFNLEMLMHLLHHDEKGFASPDILDGFFSCITIDSSSPLTRTNMKGGRRRASTLMKDPAYLQAALQLYNKIQEMVATNTFIKVVHTHRRTSFQSNEELLEAQDHFPPAVSPAPHALLLSQPPSFIGLSKQSSKDAEEAGLTRALSMLTSFNEEQFCKDMVEICYDFNISLERKTIYDLMLDDQKESLHDRVATYLEKENEEAYQLHHITFSDLNEEAYHWEKATIWGNAMSGYYRAGMLLYGLGALREAHEYFGNAYRMLLMLRRDAKIKESSYTSIKLDELLAELEFINKEKEKESLRRQRSIEQRRRSKEINAIKEAGEKAEEEGEGDGDILISEEVIDSRLSSKNQLTHGDYALTKIDIYNTFGGDSTLLEIAVNLLLRLGQTALFLGEQVAITSAIFEDALRLMLLTWPRKHDHRDDQRDFTEFTPDSARENNNKGNPMIQMKRQRSTMRGSGAMSILDVKAKMDSFKLKDPSICFPIVSSISLLYRGRRLQDDDGNSKEWSLYSILLNLAKSSLQHYRIHYVQAIALMSSFSIERAQYDQAIAYLTEIKTWYNSSTYHLQLVHLYGEDRIPATIANIAQMMLLQGYLPHAMVVLKELHVCGGKLEHQFSLGMLMYTMCSIYLLCGNFSEAEKMFHVAHRNGKRRSPRDRIIANHEEVLGEMSDVLADFFIFNKMIDQEEYDELIKLVFTSKPLLSSHSTPHHHGSGRHTTPSPALGSHHTTPHANHSEGRTLSGRLTRILQRHYLNNTNVSVVWEAAANLGLGIEYLCAQITIAIAIAMFKTNYKSDEITGKEMLLIGSEYYDAAIAKIGSSHRLLAYYLLLMISKIEVLIHLYLYPEELVEKKEEVYKDLLVCLKDIGKKIDENGFIFIYLRIIKLLQELKADSFLSEAVLKEVFSGVIGDKLVGEEVINREGEGEGEREGGSILTVIEEMVFTQLEGKVCDYHSHQTKEFQQLFQSSLNGVISDHSQGISEAKGDDTSSPSSPSSPHHLQLLLRQYTTSLFTK